MRHALPLVAALAALALVPATAAAKEISKVEVCGAHHRCADVEGDQDTRMLAASSGIPGEPPPPAAPWYQVRVTVSGAPGEDMEPFTFKYDWVPSAGLVRARGDSGGWDWAEAAPNTARVLRRTAHGLPARPASTLRGLHATVPQAKVGETWTVTPPAPTPASPSSPARDGGGAPWGWLVVGAGAAAAAAGLVVRRVRRRGGPGPAPVTG